MTLCETQQYKIFRHIFNFWLKHSLPLVSPFVTRTLAERELTVPTLLKTRHVYVPS